MDRLDLENMLIAMESLGAPSRDGKHRSKPSRVAAMSRDEAWTKLGNILETHDASGRPLSGSREPAPPTSPEPASPQIQDPGSTSLFSSAVTSPSGVVDETPGGPSLRGVTGAFDTAPGTSHAGAARRKCAALTRSGNACRTYARGNSDYCFAHDRDSRDEFIAASAAAGRASGQVRRQRAAFEIEHLSLHCNVGLQVALDAVFRLELTGQLAPQRTRALIRILTLAARGVDRTEEFDPVSFGDLRESVDRDLGAIVDEQRRADISREVTRVEHQQMERGQLAMDIERWPQLDRRPASSRKLDIADYRSARDHPDFR